MFQAIKYTKKGFVRVSASLKENHFVLSVADSGIGIPKAEVQNIWGKFNRVTSAQARSIEGTGIGLAFTLELVKIHKGDVDVESEPGYGRCAPAAWLTPARALTHVQHISHPAPDRERTLAARKPHQRGCGGLHESRARSRHAHGRRGPAVAASGRDDDGRRGNDFV
jgi:hypothetical protein